MNKVRRHNVIKEIVATRSIRTQSELAENLKNRGINVTQATVSRDIAEIPLQKIRTLNGIVYDWRGPAVTAGERLARIMRESVLQVHRSENLVLLKTEPGMAGAVAVVLDEAPLETKLGTIAGDDTILIVARSAPAAKELRKFLRDMLE